MADEKNTEKKDQPKKPARKPAAKKPAAKKPAAKKPAASSAGPKKPAAKPKPKAETATKGSGAAEATSKTADSKAAEKSTAKKPAAKKPAAKKPASKSEAKPSRREKKEDPERPVVNARARFVRVAPRKARLVADQVRGLALDDALPLLRFSTRGAAQDIRKLLESAAANAEANHDLVADDLMIKDIHVDEGPTLRRYRPRALGRATRINKRTSHIAVALTPED